MLHRIICLAIGLLCCSISLSDPDSAIREEEKKTCSPEIKAALAQSKEDNERLAILCAQNLANSRGIPIPHRRNAEECPEGVLTYGKFFQLAMQLQDEDKRAQFLQCHGEQYQQMIAYGDFEVANAYAKSLAELRARGGEEGDLIYKDKCAVGVFQCLSSSHREDLWTFYVKENDWLSDVVSHTGFQRLLDNAVEDLQNRLVSDLTALHANVSSAREFYEEIHAFSKTDTSNERALIHEDFLSLMMTLFDKFGGLLERTYQLGCSPLEVCQVILGNLEYIEQAYMEDAERTARKLANLAHGDVELWNIVQRSYESLFLLDLSPEIAPEVLKRYGDYNLGSMLSIQFEQRREYILPILKGLQLYDDLAYQTLRDYGKDANFLKWLRHPKVGHLVFPMIIFKGYSLTMSKLEDDLDWLKRYVNPDGRIRKDAHSVIEALPFVGGIATVCKYWAAGEPCEWSEIGWAALDIADITLTVCTLGTSTIVTTGPKQTVKTGSEKVFRTVVKKQMKDAATKSIIRTIDRKIIKKATTGMLKGAFVVKSLSRSVKILKSICLVSYKIIKTPFVKAYHVWKAMHPTVRKIVLGTSASLIFAYTVKHRTIPWWEQHGAEWLSQVQHKVVDTFIPQNEILNAINQFIRKCGGVPWRIYLGVFGICLILYALFPLLRLFFSHRRHKVESV